MPLLADLSPLRESPDFRRLWAGTTLSAVGGAMTTFAVALQVYDITRSSAAVGLLGLVALVPLLAVGLPGGALIDAAGPRQLAAGLALQRITFQVTIIGGPLLAGAVAAAPHLGLRGCYLIDTVSFAAALYGTGRLPHDNSKKRGARAVSDDDGHGDDGHGDDDEAGIDAENQEPAADRRERAGVSPVLAGLSFIGRTPVLAGAFGADAAATFFGLPTSLFPAIVIAAAIPAFRRYRARPSGD